jgi:hypothetical protein
MLRIGAQSRARPGQEPRRLQHVADRDTPDEKDLMKHEDFEALWSRLNDELALLIDRHPILRQLPALDKRNAAYTAAHDILGAVRANRSRICDQHFDTREASPACGSGQGVGPAPSIPTHQPARKGLAICQ